MSFGDEMHDPHRPTALLFKCRRCDGLVEEAHPDVEVALRRAIESGMAFSVHACADGAEGVAEIIGTGPGRPPGARREESHAAP